MYLCPQNRQYSLTSAVGRKALFTHREDNVRFVVDKKTKTVLVPKFPSPWPILLPQMVYKRSLHPNGGRLDRQRAKLRDWISPQLEDKKFLHAAIKFPTQTAINASRFTVCDCDVPYVHSPTVRTIIRFNILHEILTKTRNFEAKLWGQHPLKGPTHSKLNCAF
jgi:hypothetical protein